MLSEPTHPAHTHVELTAFRSERVIITIQKGAIRYKVLQVFFGRDGSIFVNFPYFRHREGILGVATLPANATATTAVNVEHCGKVASHLVKYSHHPDGRAHFSQDGKVRTEIKRQSVPLDEHGGHIFSVLIQGLTAFVRTDASRRYSAYSQTCDHQFRCEFCCPRPSEYIQDCRSMVQHPRHAVQRCRPRQDWSHRADATT